MRYLAAHGLPADLAHEYHFLPPPGVESCSEAAGFGMNRSGATKPGRFPVRLTVFAADGTSVGTAQSVRVR